MSKKSTQVAGLILLVSSSVAMSVEAAEEYISAERLQYKESDERIKVDYTTLSVLKNFGLDFTVSANFSEDEITGATPVWTDDVSGASPRLALKETGMISDPKVSLDEFSYVKANMEDRRHASDISVTWRTPKKRDELTVGINQSKEEDYKSKGLSVNYLHYVDESKNRSVSAGISVLDNDAEFRRTNEWKNAKYYNAEVGFTQILSPKALINVSGFVMKDKGALTNPYQTVIRSVNVGLDGKPRHQLFLSPEKRPDSRNVVGLKVSGVKRLPQKVLDQPLTINGSYRLYQDDWGQTAHTLNGQVFIGDLDSKGRLMLGARVSHQSSANFFKSHDDEDKIFNLTDYASSDDRLGKMTSTSVQAGYEYRYAEHWHLLSHAAYQHQSTGLNSTWFGAGLRYDF